MCSYGVIFAGGATLHYRFPTSLLFHSTEPKGSFTFFVPFPTRPDLSYCRFDRTYPLDRSRQTIRKAWAANPAKTHMFRGGTAISQFERGECQTHFGLFAAPYSKCVCRLDETLMGCTFSIDCMPMGDLSDLEDITKSVDNIERSTVLQSSPKSHSQQFGEPAQDFKESNLNVHHDTHEDQSAHPLGFGGSSPWPQQANFQSDTDPNQRVQYWSNVESVPHVQKKKYNPFDDPIDCSVKPWEELLSYPMNPFEQPPSRLTNSFEQLFSYPANPFAQPLSYSKNPFEEPWSKSTNSFKPLSYPTHLFAQPRSYSTNPFEELSPHSTNPFADHGTTGTSIPQVSTERNVEAEAFNKWLIEQDLATSHLPSTLKVSEFKCTKSEIEAIFTRDTFKSLQKDHELAETLAVLGTEPHEGQLEKCIILLTSVLPVKTKQNELALISWEKFNEQLFCSNGNFAKLENYLNEETMNSIQKQAWENILIVKNLWDTDEIQRIPEVFSGLPLRMITLDIAVKKAMERFESLPDISGLKQCAPIIEGFCDQYFKNFRDHQLFNDSRVISAVKLLNGWMKLLKKYPDLTGLEKDMLKRFSRVHSLCMETLRNNKTHG
ncbi:hypothetical protein CROQUDRAFT_105178 [Cronartium quercuum f. sp. fusiforme G11]|uniref:Uncharacterized protein n=1 Tax=Cronartium quercuum f. sp. fusiforme G11 TaxID=708437 RepID=A0A9P6NNP6_9BASI|nr:hypothetical protein CROQUDRAFT_105178 [Cronartium quercuum f. sp. fusiforme G11]